MRKPNLKELGWKLSKMLLFLLESPASLSFHFHIYVHINKYIHKFHQYLFLVLFYFHFNNNNKTWKRLNLPIERAIPISIYLKEGKKKFCLKKTLKFIYISPKEWLIKSFLSLWFGFPLCWSRRNRIWKKLREMIYTSFFIIQSQIELWWLRDLLLSHPSLFLCVLLKQARSYLTAKIKTTNHHKWVGPTGWNKKASKNGRDEMRGLR